MNKRRSKIILIITFILVLFFFYIFSCRSCSSCRGEEQDTPTSTLPSISFDGEVEYSEVGSTGYVTLPATTGFTFVADESSQNISIENSDENEYAFIFSLYLGDGALLFESDYILPGETLDEIELTQNLTSGLYENSLLVYTICTADSSYLAVSQCEIPVEILALN